jgi:hypothetical protein
MLSGLRQRTHMSVQTKWSGSSGLERIKLGFRNGQRSTQATATGANTPVVCIMASPPRTAFA